MSGWPFVARGGELKRALDALDGGSGYRGVVMVGEAGAGKTTLARVIAESLDPSGLTSRFVLGTQTGQSVPLGAFHRSVPVDDPHEPAVLLAAAHHVLTRQRDLLLVVDDAHLLDPLSAILVQAPRPRKSRRRSTRTAPMN